MSEGQFNAAMVRDQGLQSDVIQLQYHDPNPDHNLTVAVAPGLGANMYQYDVGRHKVIYCDMELLKAGKWTGTPVLCPIPNRVRSDENKKEFVFERDKPYSLEGVVRQDREVDDPLIHGLVDDKVWEVLKLENDDTSAQAATQIEIAPGNDIYRYYPFPSELTLNYILSASGIRVEYTLKNLGDKRMPYAFALHPYFRTLSGLDQTLVTLPANSIMEADSSLLPTGKLLPMDGQPDDLREPKPVSKLKLDHVYTDLIRGAEPSIRYSTLGLTIVLKSSPAFTHMVLFTEEADRDYFCYENQTSSTNAINLHTKAVKEGDERLKRAAHLMILEPGDSHTEHIEYEARFDAAV